MSEAEGSRVDYWKNRWNDGQTQWHKSEVHQILTTYFDKTFPSASETKIFVPLCGKTVDMKWFYDKKMSVVGLDGVKQSLEQFLSEQGIESSVQKVPSLGDQAEVFISSDDKMHLYCADLFKFSKEIEGTFDAVWDRGSLVALNREDVKEYVKIIKSLLKPGGRCLLEIFEYDVTKVVGHPPPHPMLESEVRQLYESDCTVELLHRMETKIGRKYDAETLAFLITKN